MPHATNTLPRPLRYRSWPVTPPAAALDPVADGEPLPARETVEQMAARTGLPIELLAARVVFTLDEASEPVEGEVLGPADPHELLGDETPGGLSAYTCRCGRWEAIVTGPRSARWARADHRRHRTEP